MAKEYFVLSHWSTLIENLKESPMKFYELVESEITKQQVPDVKISHTKMKEASMFSSQREYLTVERKHHTFDVCAAPFGNGYFVSTWLSTAVSGIRKLFYLLSRIPLIGRLFSTSFADVTFYQQDTSAMFQKTIHNAVLKVVDDMTKTKGLKILTESERKPIMSAFAIPKSLKR